jgi:phosphoserine phosphatase RsbU/P
MHEIKCGEVWGGISENNLDLMTSGIEASLYSSAYDGGKGGDVYYLSVCDSDLLTRVVLADVMGHGEVVSNTSQWICDSLRHRMNSTSGHDVLSDLNVAAVEYGYKALTTAAVVAYYRHRKEFFYTYAGHHPVLVRRAGENQWQPLEVPKTDRIANLPLGISREVEYDQETVLLHSGDNIFVFTDGVLESENPNAELFGESLLIETLNNAENEPAKINQAVTLALEKFVAGAKVHDDVSYISIKIR